MHAVKAIVAMDNCAMHYTKRDLSMCPRSPSNMTLDLSYEHSRLSPADTK